MHIENDSKYLFDFRFRMGCAGNTERPGVNKGGGVKQRPG